MIARVARILGVKGDTLNEKPSVVKKCMARRWFSCSWSSPRSIQPVGVVMSPLASKKGIGSPSCSV